MSAWIGLTSLHFLPSNDAYLVECKVQNSGKVFINPSCISVF